MEKNQINTHTHVSYTYGLSECLFEFEKSHSQPFGIVFE